MIKILFIFLIFLSLPLLDSTITHVEDGKIILAEPIRYPKDFNELYVFVETKENGWVFDECKLGERTSPYLTWNSGVKLFESTTKDFRDRAFDMLLFFTLAPKEYALDFCGDHNGRPTLHGPGLQEFLDWFRNPEQYEQERFPLVAEAVANKIASLFSLFLMP